MGFLFKPFQFLSLCPAEELTEVHPLKGGSPSHDPWDCAVCTSSSLWSGFLTLLIQRHGDSCVEQNAWTRFERLSERFFDGRKSERPFLFLETGVRPSLLNLLSPCLWRLCTHPSDEEIGVRHQVALVLERHLLEKYLKRTDVCVHLRKDLNQPADE